MTLLDRLLEAARRQVAEIQIERRGVAGLAGPPP